MRNFRANCLFGFLGLQIKGVRSSCTFLSVTGRLPCPVSQHIRRGADKSVARPNSRYRRTESIVSLERGVCVCVPNCKSFLVTEGLEGSMSGDARDFNIETRAVIKFFFSPARQGAEGNSRHSERNIRKTSTIICHCQELGSPV